MAAAAYSAVGIAVMAVGFVVLDVLTPGHLRTQVWGERNPNAALLVGSKLAGLAIIVIAAIFAGEGGLARGLLYTAAYSAVGIVAMTVVFFVVDLVTPGKLGEVLLETEHNPAVRVNAVLQLAVAGIVAASVL
ncbi:DUF350 domain-containing protein [Gordonia sp. (in: high G+C Gram-positive bacteria)]|uniref:DUF350 domain-containing protein n=1 Tax=Gordonia sp. (in: high G+C Gram-positive bacteria) TaxID=84139 RepID=UPI0039E4C97F